MYWLDTCTELFRIKGVARRSFRESDWTQTPKGHGIYLTRMSEWKQMKAEGS